MSSNTSKTFRVTNDYEVAYPNPIKLSVGDTITITKRETHPDWLGWVFCLDKTGVGGWVSEKYLEISDDKAQVLRSYDATELALSKGEIVSSSQEEFGWARVRNRHGKEGWAPLKNLTSDAGNDRSNLETE